MRLRLLARRLEAAPPSAERDELLGRTRLRMVEVEAWDELGPPSSMAALSDERISRARNHSPLAP
jgi:hypothetical protein